MSLFFSLSPCLVTGLKSGLRGQRTAFVRAILPCSVRSAQIHQGGHFKNVVVGENGKTVRKRSFRQQLLWSGQAMKRRNGRGLIAELRTTRSKLRSRMAQIIERENIWTVPNILCVTRIILSPYLGYLILQSDFTLAFYVMTFAGATDLLDGYIARTWKSQSTKFGSFLDPLADKILVSTMFVTLTYVDIIPIELTTIIILRDIALAAAGFYIRYCSLPPPKTLSRYFDPSHATAQLVPTNISKVNTAVQLLTVAVTLTYSAIGVGIHPILPYLWCGTGGLTVASAASYVFSKDTYQLLKKGKP